MINFLKKIIWINLLILFLFVLDRISRWLVLNVLPREGVFLIPNTTGFILERNQGIAYSIPLPQTFLIIVVAIIILVLMVILIKAYKQKDLMIISAFSLIIVGAISNLLDRLRYEYVIDMIVLTSWPVFNLADIMILAGFVMVFLQMVRRK